MLSPEQLRDTPCPICQSLCEIHDVVDFNKSCEENRGIFLPLSGIPIYYLLCTTCGFCFAPECYTWTKQEFSDRVYNQGYAAIDPDYAEIRPTGSANSLISMFGGKEYSHDIRHLDYGGGNGRLTALLQQNGFNSSYYDPFVHSDEELGNLGKFNLITAIEVFEHVPDVHQLMRELNQLLTDDGIVLFTTGISDGLIQDKKKVTSWWYTAPRNGHISIFSSNSISRLAQQYGFLFGTGGWHILLKQRSVPRFAEHIIKVN